MRKSERGVLVGIVLAIALAVRIGFVATATVQNPLRADAGQYAQYAKNLVEHGVFSLANGAAPAPDSFRSPGYALVLAGCRLLGGDTGWQGLAIALQVALGTLTVLLVYRLARSLTGFGPALLAAGLCALSPHLVVACGYVLTECVTAFFVACGLWLWLPAATRRRELAGAACLGFAVACNEALLGLPIAVAWAAWRAQGRRVLLPLAVALLPFVAWTVRGQCQTLAKTGGERVVASISHGSYPGMVFRDPRYFGFPYREDPAQPAFGASWANLGGVLRERVAAEPLRYAAWYLLDKPAWLWSWPLVQGRDVCVYEVANSPYERQPVMQASHTLMRLLHPPIMLVAALAAVGALVWRRRVAWQWMALGAVVAMATLAYLPVIPDPRYLQPVRPLCFVLAALGLAAAAAFVVPRLRAPAPAAAVGRDDG